MSTGGLELPDWSPCIYLMYFNYLKILALITSVKQDLSLVSQRVGLERERVVPECEHVCVVPECKRVRVVPECEHERVIP